MPYLNDILQHAGNHTWRTWRNSSAAVNKRNRFVSLTRSTVGGACHDSTAGSIHFIHRTVLKHKRRGAATKIDEINPHCITRQEIHGGYHCLPLHTDNINGRAKKKNTVLTGGTGNIGWSNCPTTLAAGLLTGDPLFPRPPFASTPVPSAGM